MSPRKKIPKVHAAVPPCIGHPWCAWHREHERTDVACARAIWHDDNGLARRRARLDAADLARAAAVEIRARHEALPQGSQLSFDLGST